MSNPPVSRTIAELFSAQVERAPDATAITYHRTRWTYARLHERAGRLASWIAAHAAGSDGPPALPPFCLRRGPDQIAVLLAAARLGAAYVPLDPRSPRARSRLILDDLAAPLVIADASTRDDLAGAASSARILDLDESAGEIRGFAPDRARAVKGPDDPCYVMYTSGSTGRPKGAIIPTAG